MVRYGFVDQAQIDDEVARAVRMLGPEVVRVNHSVGEDTSGEPAIYFRIVLADEATGEETLADVANNIYDILVKEIRPYEKWGLFPYTRFRGKSEQAMRSEPEWS
jgi:hypothetical protein